MKINHFEVLTHISLQQYSYRIITFEVHTNCDNCKPKPELWLNYLKFRQKELNFTPTQGHQWSVYVNSFWVESRLQTTINVSLTDCSCNFANVNGISVWLIRFPSKSSVLHHRCVSVLFCCWFFNQSIFFTLVYLPMLVWIYWLIFHRNVIMRLVS